jgi:hypothetical protein
LQFNSQDAWSMIVWKIDFFPVTKLTTPARDPDPTSLNAATRNQEQDHEQEAKNWIGFAESGRRR